MGKDSHWELWWPWEILYKGCTAEENFSLCLLPVSFLFSWEQLVHPIQFIDAYNYLWLCFASFSATYTSILVGRVIKIICTNINIYVRQLILLVLFVCWTWHPHASWHQASIVVELPVTTFLVYLQANDSRKELHDKEKEVLDLRQEVIGLKHSLKEANDQCTLLFNEVQKAWRVSSTLQADLKVDFNYLQCLLLILLSPVCFSLHIVDHSLRVVTICKLKQTGPRL